MPVLLLTFLFNPIVAGYYTLSRTVLGIPSQLIGKSIGAVFYPSIAETFNKGLDISKMLIKATLILSLFGMLPFGLIFIFGPELFKIIFGDEWYLAGEYARWLSLWSYCLLINIPAVKALPVLSAQSFHLKYSFFMLIVRTLSMVIVYYIFRDEIKVIQSAAISSALLNILLIIITIKISKEIKK